MSLEKYGETIIMKDHLCWVQMFGAYPSGNDQLLKDFIGNRMQCDQSFSKTTLERKLETIVETVEIENSNEIGNESSDKRISLENFVKR